ncbi:MAG: c-type cytochrome [Marivibrio sp.]|uniref:c-type cytochrome n=1 Tax=Marivibrio sp. TaxID=2039719 RepID=UPI0032EB8320
MKRTVMMAAAFGAALVSGNAAAVAQDGETLFKRCMACHALEEGKHKVGPSLYGVVGRAAGTADGYRYSKINSQAGELGLVWTKENMAAYLPDPQGFLEAFIEENGGDPQGRTKMTYRLRDEGDAATVVDYVASHGGNGG